MINNIIMLINELNLNKKKNKKFLITKINKNKINLLKIFLKYNIISYFIILENNIKVFLNNNNKLKIEIYSSKNNQNFIKKKKLLNLVKKENCLYILSTSNGLVTTDSGNISSGGLLLLKILNF